MRLIDADALLESTKKYVYQSDLTTTVAIGIAETWIKNAPTVGGWISTKDRLPEKDGLYLAWVLWPDDEYPVQSIINYDACAEDFGEWREYFNAVTLGLEGSDFERINNVLYWMPLPEPPKEGA